MTSAEAPEFGMLTIFDEISRARPVPADFDTGVDPAFVIYDGVTRGVAILARCARFEVLIGLKVAPHESDLRVTMRLTLDDVAHAWWSRKFTDLPEEASLLPRHVVVRCQGEVVGGFSMGGAEQRIESSFTIPGDTVNPGGLLMIHLVDADTSGFEGEVNQASMLGVQVDSIQIRPAGDPPRTSIYLVDPEEEDLFTPQGSVVLRKETPRVRFRIVEKPPIAQPLRRSGLTYPLGRVLRKAGVVRRATQRKLAARQESPSDVEWPITAFTPDGSSVPVRARILPDDDVVELQFPDSAPGEAVFFELQAHGPSLTRAGYSEHVAFRRL